MKPHKHLHIICFVLLQFLVAAAQCATVVWPAVTLGLFSLDTATHIIASDLSPSGGAGVWLELLSDPGPAFSLQAYTMTAGIGHLWFATQHGHAVDESALADADYLVRSDTMEVGSIEMPLHQVFYLGFRLDGSDPPVSYYIYGWAALFWDGTELTLTDSAAETTGVGIYAGTYNPVPEPASSALALAGLATLAVRRRRTRRPGGRGCMPPGS